MIAILPVHEVVTVNILRLFAVNATYQSVVFTETHLYSVKPSVFGLLKYKKK